MSILPIIKWQAVLNRMRGLLPAPVQNLLQDHLQAVLQSEYLDLICATLTTISASQLFHISFEYVCALYIQKCPKHKLLHLKLILLKTYLLWLLPLSPQVHKESRNGLVVCECEIA